MEASLRKTGVETKEGGREAPFTLYVCSEVAEIFAAVQRALRECKKEVPRREPQSPQSFYADEITRR